MYNMPHNMPIEVGICINDLEVRNTANTKELLILLQDIADEWFQKQVPTIPCGYLPRVANKEY